MWPPLRAEPRRRAGILDRRLHAELPGDRGALRHGPAAGAARHLARSAVAARALRRRRDHDPVAYRLLPRLEGPLARDRSHGPPGAARGLRPVIHVRWATPDDAAAIATVHVHAWQAAYAGILPEAFLRSLS